MVRKLSHLEVLDAVKALGSVLRAAKEETGFELAQNDEHLALTWSNLVHQGVGHAYGLYRDADIKGILLGLIFPDSLTGHKRGHECLWVVDKSARLHSLKLMDEFAHDCKQAGCHDMVFTLTSGPTADKMRRLYSRIGFHPVAEAFSQKL